MATPRGERLIITLLGRRNVGKSSLINGITEQEISIVSKTPGTTTDPVAKHYELIPVGPVTFYDTAGIDDIGELGEQRVKATRRVLWRSDVVMLVFDKDTLNEHDKN
ncbi:MAG: [FeFe] hydrogenase H-cluster maturation GTPase HydF, partial [Candidatus Neomarinimicrobiota bacterium]